MYMVENLASLPQPVMFYHSNISDSLIAREAATHRSGRNKPIRFNIQVMGTDNSIAEALVVKVALDVLDELGISGRRVHINGIGDRDAVNRFRKELNGFYRKNISIFTPEEQEHLKNDPLGFYQLFIRSNHDLVCEAPTTLEFLSESSRRHLWNVLEYFEQTGIEYEIDPSLIASKYYTNTIFEIQKYDEDQEGELEYKAANNYNLLAHGGRYNDLGRCFYRNEVPSAGIVIECAALHNKNITLPRTRSMAPYRLYLLHLGSEAKVKSLNVLSILREAHMPTYQSLGASSFTDQLEHAYSLKVPYALILGHKEAIENTIIVRDMHTQSQNVVPIDTLQTYLKRLRVR